MERIKLLKGNVNEVKFGVSVSGADVKVDEVRMMVDSGKGFSYVVGARDINSSEVVFLFDAVSMGLKEGVDYKGVMEVYVGGQRFEPFECVFEVVEPVKVEMREAKVVKEEIKIEVKPVVEKVKDVSEEKKVEKSKKKFMFVEK